MVDATVNADPAEIARFQAAASRWWDPEGEMRPLHDLNPVRLRYVARSAPLAGRTVADVGVAGDDARPGVLDELDGGGEILRCRQRIGNAGDLLAQIHRDDVGACRGQSDRVGAALASGRAGDEGDFAV
jgi:hypothetical protein